MAAPRSIASTFILVLLVWGDMRAQETLTAASAPRPTISIATPDSLYSPSRIFKHVPNRFASFTGLILEEVPTTTYQPILPYIYFDSASATIPTRYRLLDSFEQTLGFDESKLPNDRLEIHHRTLDIIGSRLRRLPKASISIVGCSSGQPELGETRSISEARGRAVYDYLRTVWRIPEKQITLLPARDVPEFRDYSGDHMKHMLNRRAEITPVGDGWDIVHPIAFAGSWPDTYPLSISFNGTNGLPDSLVRDRVLEVRRCGILVNSILDRQHRRIDWRASSPWQDTWEPIVYDWSGFDDTHPEKIDSAYVFRLVVNGIDGSQTYSNEVRIPVLHITPAMMRTEFRVDRRILWISLVPYGFNEFGKVRLVTVDSLTIHRHLYPVLTPKSAIKVLTSWDRVGSEHMSTPFWPKSSWLLVEHIKESGVKYKSIAASHMTSRSHYLVTPAEERHIDRCYHIYVDTKVER